MLETIQQGTGVSIPTPENIRQLAEPFEKPPQEQEIEGMDQQIHNLVYALYGLTEDKVKDVKGK